MAKVIGFSGSTVKNGALEKAMTEVLKATGHEWELIRLHSIDMKQCTGCVGCGTTNRCVLKDDATEMLERILEADAVVFGGVARYGSLNSLTKMFIERLFPLIHRKRPTEGKVAASVAGGFFHQAKVTEELAGAMTTFQMNNVGSLEIEGNASCFKCGHGESCDYSAFRAKYGPEAKITKDVFYKFENDEKAKAEAAELGRKIAQAIGK